MRTSTIGFINQSITGITDLQGALQDRQAQLSSGKRIQRVSDDPLASARMISLTQDNSYIQRFDDSIKVAQNNLSIQDTLLEEYSTHLTRLNELTLQAGNADLTASNRQAIAVDMQQVLDALTSLANSRNADGLYLFSGNRSTQQAFAKDTAGRFIYQGDQGQRMTQVGSSLNIVTNDPGSDIFSNVPAPPGTFLTAAGRDNQGNAQITRGNVTDPTALQQTLGQGYVIKFNASAGLPNFSVFAANDLDNPVSGWDHVNFSSGMNITLSGVTFSINGQPNAGDTFRLAPAPKQNIFDSIQTYIDALNNQQSSTNLDFATQNMLTSLESARSVASNVQAKGGARLAILDSQTQINANITFANQSTLAEISEVDYAKVISEMSQLSLALEASQKMYIKVNQLHLFNFM